MNLVRLDHSAMDYLYESEGRECRIGFARLRVLTAALSSELDFDVGQLDKTGSQRNWRCYQLVLERLRLRHLKTGFISSVMLYDPFIGWEGNVIKVWYPWGVTQRFRLYRKEDGMFYRHYMYNKNKCLGEVMYGAILNFLVCGKKHRQPFHKMREVYLPSLYDNNI